MANLTYVTTNNGKYLRVKELFEGIDIDFFNYETNEPDVNDIEYISKCKVMEAYNILQSPCFVTDSGFYIENYPNNPGYPGAFVKRSGISKDIDKLLDTMKEVKERDCYFLDCLTFYDGVDFYTFYGHSYGTLSYVKRGSDMKKSQSNLWLVFIPEGYNKTMAEMTDYERNNKKSTSAKEEFMKWYRDVYSNDKKRDEIRVKTMIK